MVIEGNELFVKSRFFYCSVVRIQCRLLPVFSTKHGLPRREAMPLEKHLGVAVSKSN